MVKSKKAKKLLAAAEDAEGVWINAGGEFDDLFSSLFLIVVVCIVAQVLRFIISVACPNKKVRAVLQEIIATAELCTTCFELGIIEENYGTEYYGVFYFAASLWWSLTWNDAYASPNGHLEDLLNGDADGEMTLLMSVVELVTASLAFKLFVRPLWGFKWTKLHKKKLKAKMCTADLSVSPFYGSIIEGGGTMLFSILSKLIGRQMNNNIFATVLSSVLDTFLVVIALEFSGGFYNPVLATSMQYGCEGASVVDHVWVYWVSGIVGTLFGTFVSSVFIPKSRR